tara:strand:+ start:210 stop:518 length:309 start_codon:yes stop_codon:yes gene_type:complete
MTITDLKNNDDNKIKSTILSLSNQIKNLKVDEFKNKRYIEALENQIRLMAAKLKELNQKPQVNILDILKDINEQTAKEKGMTKQDIKELDEDIEAKLKLLMM